MSMIENDTILEQYYEQFIDQGHTQEDAERLANKMMENRGDNGYECSIEEED
tara:strand:- start:740 stop:895 length:156 start_codon:yes stop_codon:yes gene_type:complete